MKKILLIVVFIISLGKIFAQETVTFAIKARGVEVLVNNIKGSEDTAAIYLFNEWVKAWGVQNPPTGTTIVSVPNVSVRVIARLYERVLSFPQGAADAKTDFNEDIASIRTGTLDALCDIIDLRYAGEIPALRQRGRKTLTGKN